MGTINETTIFINDVMSSSPSMSEQWNLKSDIINEKIITLQNLKDKNNLKLKQATSETDISTLLKEIETQISSSNSYQSLEKAMTICIDLLNDEIKQEEEVFKTLNKIEELENTKTKLYQDIQNLNHLTIEELMNINNNKVINNMMHTEYLDTIACCDDPEKYGLLLKNKIWKNLISKHTQIQRDEPAIDYNKYRNDELIQDLQNKINIAKFILNFEKQYEILCKKIYKFENNLQDFQANAFKDFYSEYMYFSSLLLQFVSSSMSEINRFEKNTFNILVKNLYSAIEENGMGMNFPRNEFHSNVATEKQNLQINEYIKTHPKIICDSTKNYATITEDILNKIYSNLLTLNETNQDAKIENKNDIINQTNNIKSIESAYNKHCINLELLDYYSDLATNKKATKFIKEFSNKTITNKEILKSLIAMISENFNEEKSKLLLTPILLKIIIKTKTNEDNTIISKISLAIQKVATLKDELTDSEKNNILDTFFSLYDDLIKMLETDDWIKDILKKIKKTND